MSRQPVFNVPRVVIILLAAMAAIHGARLAMPDDWDGRVLAAAAFVPARLTLAVRPDAVASALGDLARADPGPEGAAAAGLFFLGDGSQQPWTVLTYAMLHGDWTHLGLNAVWLLAFGAPLARRVGAPRFLTFCALGAIAGAATHWMVDIVSFQPLIGASAAVSACMGAATRFAFQSVPAGGRGEAARAESAPRLSILAMLREPRALWFLGLWFATNLATGLLAVPLGLSQFPIAWQAHVGGFLFGLLALPLVDRAPATLPAPTPS